MNGQTYAHVLAEEKILVALEVRGAMSFRQIHRKVLPGLHYRELDSTLRKLRVRGLIQTSTTGPKVWSRVTPTASPSTPRPSQ